MKDPNEIMWVNPRDVFCPLCRSRMVFTAVFFSAEGDIHLNCYCPTCNNSEASFDTDFMTEMAKFENPARRN